MPKQDSRINANYAFYFLLKKAFYFILQPKFIFDNIFFVQRFLLSKIWTINKDVLTKHSQSTLNTSLHHLVNFPISAEILSSSYSPLRFNNRAFSLLSPPPFKSSSRMYNDRIKDQTIKGRVLLFPTIRGHLRFTLAETARPCFTLNMTET